MPTIFTDIINKKVFSYDLYENDLIYSFLTKDPINIGHSLIIPKKEIDNFLDLKKPYYTEIFNVAQLLGKAIEKATNCKRIGLIVAGYEIAHFHLHVIPTYSIDDFDFKKTKNYTKEENLNIQNKIKNNMQKLKSNWNEI